MVNLLNFRYVLLENRPLVGAMAGVGWNVYLSSVVNSPTSSCSSITAGSSSTTATTTAAAQEKKVYLSSAVNSPSATSSSITTATDNGACITVDTEATPSGSPVVAADGAAAVVTRAADDMVKQGNQGKEGTIGQVVVLKHTMTGSRVVVRGKGGAGEESGGGMMAGLVGGLRSIIHR